MDNSLYQESFALHFVKAMFREARLHKVKVALCFAIVSLIVLLVGVAFPKKYETHTSIFVDNQNIIQPLLKNRAQVTKISDRVKVVRESIYSPRLIADVAEAAGIAKGDESPTEMEGMSRRITSKLRVVATSANFIRIEYSSESPEEAFNRPRYK